MDQPKNVPPGASPRSGKPPPERTRWKPGQSGNPGGRPKGRSIVASLREVLEREHNGRRIADLIAERLAKEALAGKFAFAKEVMDRVEGPVSQLHEVAVRGTFRERLRDLTAGVSPEEMATVFVEAGLAHLLPPGLRDAAINAGLLPPGPGT